MFGSATLGKILTIEHLDSLIFTKSRQPFSAGYAHLRRVIDACRPMIGDDRRVDSALSYLQNAEKRTTRRITDLPDTELKIEEYQDGPGVAQTTKPVKFGAFLHAVAVAFSALPFRCCLYVLLSLLLLHAVLVVAVRCCCC